MSRTILSAAAAAVLACGSVAVSAQTITAAEGSYGVRQNFVADFKCSQHRYTASLGPFSWRVEFRRVGERITAQRPYVPTNPRLGTDAIVSFVGMMHSDGNVEMQIVGRGAQPPGLEGFHSAMSGRVQQKGFIVTGPMMTPDGKPVRACQVIAVGG